jgi:hypothetical protein
VLQQYESEAQTSVTHESHAILSFAPATHSLCVHVEPVDSQVVGPQYVGTSAMQTESHPLVQQYVSCAQTSATQTSQEVVRAAPAVHSVCAHVEVVPQMAVPQ